MNPKKRIGEMLLEAGIIDETQLKAALGHQRQWGVRLGQALVDLKLATEADIVRALSLKFGFEVAKLDALEPYGHEQAIKLLPRDFAVRSNVFPMWADTANVTVAMSDPTNLAVVDEVRFRTGRRVKVCIGGDHEVAEAVKRCYPDDGAVEAIALDLDADGDAEMARDAVFDPFGGGSKDALEAFFGGNAEGQATELAPSAADPAEGPAASSAPPRQPPAAASVPSAPAGQAAAVPAAAQAPAARTTQPQAAAAAPAARHQPAPARPQPAPAVPRPGAKTAAGLPAQPQPAARAAPPAPARPPAPAPARAAQPAGRSSAAAAPAAPVAPAPVAAAPTAPTPRAAPPQAPARAPAPAPPAPRQPKLEIDLEEPAAAPAASPPAPPGEPVLASELAPEEMVEGPQPIRDLSDRELAILESLDRLADGAPAEPDVVKPAQAMAAMIRLLIRKRIVTEQDFLDELSKK